MVLDVAHARSQLFIDVFVDVYICSRILAYILMSWVQLPYSLRPCSASSRTSASPTCASGGASCRCRSAPIDFSPIVAIAALCSSARILIAMLNGS